MNTHTNTLINFNIPSHLKSDLDDLVKFKNCSRTSIINRLIENYIRVEFRLLDEDGRFKNLLREVKLRNKKLTKPKFLKEYLKPVHKSVTEELDEDYSPPNIPELTNTLTEDYNWEERFK